MSLPDLDPAGKLANKLRRKPRGPLRRLALFAAGGDRVMLDAVPTESSELEVLGASIIVTSVTAAGAGLLAAGYVGFGEPRLTVGTVAFGLIYGLVIFAIDRTIARSQLNPFEYPQEALDALWHPTSDTAWFGVVTDTLHRQSFFGRVKQTWRVFAGAAVRIAIACCTSYLFAQFVAFFAFDHEIDTRIDYIQRTLTADSVQKVEQRFTDASRRRKAEEARLTHINDKAYLKARNRASRLTDQASDAEADADLLAMLAGKELDGLKASITLSDHSHFKSTGHGSTGPVYTSLVDAKDSRRKHARELRAEAGDERALARAAAIRVDTRNAAQLAALKRADKSAATDLDTAIADAKEDFSRKGLLVRRDALKQITDDKRPETSAPDPYAPCKGSWKWACDAKNVLFPPTPLGPFIGVFVLLLFLIEILPVSLKIRMSMRRRRPYDALKAALEEASSAGALDMLDAALNQTGGDLERRASLRKAERTGAAAEFLLASDAKNAARREKETEPDNDLTRRLREPQRVRDPFRVRWLAQLREWAARRQRVRSEPAPDTDRTPRPSHGSRVVYLVAASMNGGATLEDLQELHFRNASNGETGSATVDEVMTWIQDGGEVRVRDRILGHDVTVQVVDGGLRAASGDSAVDALLRLPRYDEPPAVS